MKQGGLRVLLLSDAGSFHTERFARELRRQGCHVMTASLESGKMRCIQLKRLGPVKSFHYLLAVPQVKSIIKRFRPEVINAHYAAGYGFIAARAVGETKTPIALNVWGSDVLIVPNKSTQGRIKVSMALARADYVFGDSRYLLTRAEKVCRLKAQEVIPWGIEREFLSLHRTSYSPGRPLRIITPRKQEEIYNNGFILEALRPLVEKGDVELTFPDFGSCAPAFRSQVGELSGDGVNLYSKLPRAEFLAYLAEHDVYLSASRSDSSPASMIESMALGLIPVAADVEGVREWLTDESGFVFEQDNREELRSVIARIIDDGDTLEGMRRSNFRRVNEEAIFEENVARQVEVMKELAGGSS
ncbi:MAG: glycosyltransferase [Candidatus Zixiibacteriota bacterium]|nr:MAG: glycosyltransferase [candidate division Zixibacteria bacterium]